MLVVVSEEASLVERVRRIASCCAQGGALVAHARDLAEAKAMAARHGIRLYILDLALVAGDCESRISDLLEAANRSAMLVVTAGNDRESVLHALRAGAADFARHDRPPEHVESLERVLHGILEAWSDTPGSDTESSPSSSTASVREFGVNSVSDSLRILQRALDTLSQPVAVFDASTRNMLLANSAARRGNTGKPAGCSLGCNFAERFCASLGDECPLERAMAAELRALGMGIPVVVTSGMNDQATAQLARSINRCHFLPKPFTQAEASTVLRALLDEDTRHADKNSE